MLHAADGMMPLLSELTKEEQTLRQILLNATAAARAREASLIKKQLQETESYVEEELSPPPTKLSYNQRQTCFKPVISALETELIHKNQFTLLRKLIIHALQYQAMDAKADSLLKALFDPALTAFWNQWLNESHTDALIQQHLGVIYQCLSGSFVAVKKALHKKYNRYKANSPEKKFLATLAKLPNTTLPQVMLSQLRSNPPLRQQFIDTMLLETAKMLFTTLSNDEKSKLEQRFLRYSLSKHARSIHSLTECLTQHNVLQLIKAITNFDLDTAIDHNALNAWRTRLKAHNYRSPYQLLTYRALFTSPKAGQLSAPQHPLHVILAHQQYTHARRLISYHSNCLNALISQQQDDPRFVGRLQAIYFARNTYKNLNDKEKAACNAPPIITSDSLIDLTNHAEKIQVNEALYKQTITSFSAVKTDLFLAAKLGNYIARQSIAKHHISLVDYFTYQLTHRDTSQEQATIFARQTHLALINTLNITRQATTTNPGPGHILRGIILINLAKHLLRFSPHDENGIIRHRTLDKKMIKRISPSAPHHSQSLFGSTVSTADWQAPLTEVNSPFLRFFAEEAVDQRLAFIRQMVTTGLSLIGHVKDHEAKYTPALKSAGFPSPVIFPECVDTVSGLYEHCRAELGVALMHGSCGTYTPNRFTL